METSSAGTKQRDWELLRTILHFQDDGLTDLTYLIHIYFIGFSDMVVTQVGSLFIHNSTVHNGDSGMRVLQQISITGTLQQSNTFCTPNNTTSQKELQYF